MERARVTPIDVLSGLTKKWLDIITEQNMAQELAEILDIVTDCAYHPSASDMFNFARHSFDNVKVIILGMDPYPKNKDAHGLAFSTRSETCPASLNKIYNILLRESLIDKKPQSFDLSYLAAQGIVLLNTALTVEDQNPGSHIKHWSNWTDKLIRNINKNVPDGTIWCLWGKDADKKSHLIDARHTVLKAPHPVAMQTPNFSDCTHFRTIADKYPNLIWDPTKTETHFYTDCSARGNQFKDCKASYGVVCTKGLLHNKSWSGEIFTKQVMFKGSLVDARPTNIRGEGEALIKALSIAKTLPTNTKVRIFSDSKFWIVDMLEKYIPSWVECSTDFNNRKNSDLVEKFWNLSQELKDKVSFTFVNAWHDRDRPAENTEDLLWWLGNQAAERAAESALGL